MSRVTGGGYQGSRIQARESGSIGLVFPFYIVVRKTVNGFEIGSCAPAGHDWVRLRFFFETTDPPPLKLREDRFSQICTD